MATTIGLSAAMLELSAATNSRRAAQELTIDALEAMTCLDWIVNAEPAVAIGSQIPLTTDRDCANDSAHGRGTCAIVGTDDLLCPVCAINTITSQLVQDARIDVEVTL